MKKMKIKLIVFSIIIVVLLIAMSLLCVFRDRIPTRIDNLEALYDIFDISIDSDEILEEYSSYQVQTDYGRPCTDICLKLDMPHSDFENEIGFMGDKNHTTNEERKSVIVNEINTLLPEDKQLNSDTINKGGYYFLAYEYIGIPVIKICGFMTTQAVYWFCATEEDHEYVYVYTWVPRAYILDVIE